MAKRDEYGGPWTQLKLERVRQCCEVFLDDMEDSGYETVYVDACCGRGIVKVPRQTKPPAAFNIPMPEPYIEGSPMQVLRLDKAFTKYYFNDKSPECCRKLKKLIKSEFPKRKKRTKLVCKDVNAFLVDFCASTNWKRKRAMMFVDPFKPIVEWKTIKAIAETEACDLLYMFPAGIAVTRMMKRNGEIGKKAGQTLNAVLGTKQWREALYTTVEREGLISTERVTRRQQGCEAITQYFLERLASVFDYVAPNPLRLRNKNGLTMYVLCFASPSKERTERIRKLFQSGRLMAGLGLPRVDKFGRRSA